MALPVHGLFFMGPIPKLFPTLGVGTGGPTQRQGSLTFLGLPKGQLSWARAQQPSRQPLPAPKWSMAPPQLTPEPLDLSPSSQSVRSVPIPI